MKQSFLAFKSTLLGALLLALDFYILIKGISKDYVVLGVVFVVGLYCIFNKSDALIDLLEEHIFGKVLFKNEKDKKEEDKE